MTTTTGGVAPSPGLRTAAVEILAIADRRIRRLRQAPGRLIGLTLNPLISLIVLGYLFQGSISISGDGSYQEYIFAGVAAQTGLAGIGPTAVAVALDMRGGLIDRFRSMPISRSAVLVGHTLGDFVVGLAALAVVTVAGLLVGWVPHTGVLPVLAGFAVQAVFLYAMLWVGVALGMLAGNLESINLYAGVIVVGFSFLSNGFQSVDRLPGWIQPVAEWNPVSGVVALSRSLWGNPGSSGIGFADQNSTLVIAVSLGAVLLASTVLSMRRYRRASV